MAERVTTTGEPLDYTLAEPTIAPRHPPSRTPVAEPAADPPSGSGSDTTDRRRDRDKTARRKAAANPESPSPAGFGGMPPPQAATAGAAEAAPPLVAEPEDTQLPATAEPDTSQATTAAPAVEPDAAPSATPRTQPSTGPAAASTAEPSTTGPPTAPAVAGAVPSPTSPPSLPMLPTLPSVPDPSQPATDAGATTASPAGTTPDDTGDDPGDTTTTTPTFSRAQEVLDILIVLESMFGAGGMQTPGFAALEASLQPSMGSGAAAAAEYDLAVYQQNEAAAFGTLDDDLNSVLDALAGNNATYQGDMRGLILDVDAQLASLGPDAYTTAGQQQAQAILDSALSTAMQICHGSQAQSAAAAAAVDALAKAYLGSLGGLSGAAGSGSDAASIAEQYLGWEEPQLQGDGVDEAGTPYGSSCANFVSSMLQKAGLINWHTNLVADLATQLPAQGWVRVPLSDAKPGDVWICNGADGESHTEIVASNNNGQVTLIGSNNVDSGMQQVSYDSYSPSIPGSYILAPS